MHVKTSRGNLKIDWNHHIPANQNARGSTVCTVYIPHDVVKNDKGEPALVEIASATAFVHFNDNYCKNTGRKVSLTKAIKAFNKADRTAIWAGYQNMRHGKY